MNFVEAMKESLNGKDIIRLEHQKINNVFEVTRLYVSDKNSSFGKVCISWETKGWKDEYRPNYYDLTLEDYLADDYIVR